MKIWLVEHRDAQGVFMDAYVVVGDDPIDKVKAKLREAAATDVLRVGELQRGCTALVLGDVPNFAVDDERKRGESEAFENLVTGQHFVKGGRACTKLSDNAFKHFAQEKVNYIEPHAPCWPIHAPLNASIKAIGEAIAFAQEQEGRCS